MNGPGPNPSPVSELLSEFVRIVRESKLVLIGTHVNPDGDAVGSALAVSLWLDKMGVENEVVCHNDVPGYLRFLPGSDRFKLAPERTGHDLGIVLDLETFDRLGSCRRFFDPLPKTVLVDHHVPHEMAGDFRVVDPSTPATCCILTELLGEALPGIDSDIADCLLCGIVTDTGSFRFPNTTPQALHQAAMLVERGGNLARIADTVYLNKDDEAVLLLGRTLARVKTACNGQLAWATLPLDVFEEVGAREEHNEGIVNEILSMRSVRVAALLREGKPGKIRGSLRSKGDFDVASVAQSLGGGGHRNAAGISFEGTLEECEETVVKVVKSCLGC